MTLAAYKLGLQSAAAAMAWHDGILRGRRHCPFAVVQLGIFIGFYRHAFQNARRVWRLSMAGAHLIMSAAHSAASLLIIAVADGGAAQHHPGWRHQHGARVKAWRGGDAAARMLAKAQLAASAWPGVPRPA